MAAVAQRAIHRHAPGWGASAARISATMMGRCVPAGVLPEAMTFAIGLGVAAVFLVFFLEPARIFAAITLAAFVWCRRPESGKFSSDIAGILRCSAREFEAKSSWSGGGAAGFFRGHRGGGSRRGSDVLEKTLAFPRKSAHFRRRPLQRHPRLFRSARICRALSARRTGAALPVPEIFRARHRGVVRVARRETENRRRWPDVPGHGFIANHCPMPVRSRRIRQALCSG